MCKKELSEIRTSGRGGRFRFPVKNVYMCSKNMKIVVFIGERDRRGDYDRCAIDAETKKWGLRSINVTHG